MEKYAVTYQDQFSNIRQCYISAKNERDALVNAWLNNKNIANPLRVDLVKKAQKSV